MIDNDISVKLQFQVSAMDIDVHDHPLQLYPMDAECWNNQ